MRLSHLLILFVFCGALEAQPCREVAAFFPSWKWYDRGRLVNPMTLDYSKYTIINYAFLRPNKDGSISLFDPLADKTLLLGELYPYVKKSYLKSHSVEKEWHIPNTSLVDRAHNNGVKVLVSIGGWTMSENFSAIAADPKKRKRLADSCIEFIREFDVDGVDIDWEYPGYAAQNGRSNDSRNFTLLLQEIKTAFDHFSNETGKQLLLTADFGAGAAHMDKIEWEEVAPLLDQINVMTYDFYGSRPSSTNHHSPLYAPKKGVEGFDLNSSVKRLIEHHHVPAYKINIGLAFFGRSLKTKGDASIHVVSHRTTDEKTFPEDNGAPAYYNILKHRNHFHYNWDDYAEVPYLTGKKIKTFVSFDDEASIQKKGRYILENGLGGAIVWDIMSDYLEDEKRPGAIAATPLADALKASLCREEPVTIENFPTSKRPDVFVKKLPQMWPTLTYQTFAPRPSLSPASISKKEKKKMRKKEKKKKGVRKRYFDGV